MDTRRDFLRKAALLSGAGGLANILPETIQRALAINPAPGSSYLDAEHVVFLMQENRSFDHCFGTLKGVRGYNDPRAIKLENGHPVFLQSNTAGETYAPFRLNIFDTKATWMSSLPHSWADQVDARNGGKYNRWLDVKRSGHAEYKQMPLTMGYYNREDIPFYYALADAFTVCDQHFCSSLTGTTPNRLYFWTGTIRQEMHPNVKANVYNSDVDYGKEASWKTFPEVLEENNVSWKIYQNEISVGVGLEGEEDAWLANFTDNSIEWFTQYHVEYYAPHIKYLKKVVAELPAKIAAQEKEPQTEELKKTIAREKTYLENAKKVLDKVAQKPFNTLPQKEQNLHTKAFTTNQNDPDYHSLSTLKYNDGTTAREVQLPKGDILHQFREDVKKGELPAVSWIVAPENFSDHPGAPWYGAWYLSEVMDILTQNPEVWKKTVFILTYDENDGYFDHVPPFVPPTPGKANTGKVSEGIDPAVEYVTLDAQQKGRGARESSIGLGYRVPMVVASPWSRGGFVNSEVFDHTSDVQFLETFLSHKLKKKIATENITEWRRTICGDLTSVFRTYNGEKIATPAAVNKEAFIESVHKAKFKEAPANYKLLSPQEIAGPLAAIMPQQEPGIRPSCAIPYQLEADAKLSADRKKVVLRFKADNTLFGKRAAGAPFTVYADYAGEKMSIRNYAVKAGDALTDDWEIAQFAGQQYALHVYGPNGFYREIAGGENDPRLDVMVAQGKTAAVTLNFINHGKEAYTIDISDASYKGKARQVKVEPGKKLAVPVALDSSFGWYDLAIRVQGAKDFVRRYAGHVETGKPSFSDPLMGKTI